MLRHNAPRGDPGVPPRGYGGYHREAIRAARGPARLAVVTRRNLLADAALAAAVFGLLLGIAASGGLDAEPGGRGLDLLGVALVAAATLPVAARRIAPLPVFAAVSAATIALWALDYRTDIPFGPLIAIYTVGSVYGGAPWPRRIWPVLAVAVLSPVTLALYLSEGIGFVDILLPEMLMFTLLLAGVWVAGDLARLRRERIAELADRALRTEREAERERRITAAEERTRIARELHDSAGHAINVILVQAGAARLLHERDPVASRRAIATIEQVARDTIGEIDRLVRALREDDGAEPVPADPAAIEELVDRHRASGLRVDTDLRGPRRTLPRSVAWAAYRILQEALTNAARHGRGGDADVAVQFGPEAVEITVTNPAGAAESGGGHGIVGMRERANLLGGVLETGQRDGTFRLYARLPLAEAAVAP
jgi:signal transduction histidine kinase